MMEATTTRRSRRVPYTAIGLLVGGAAAVLSVIGVSNAAFTDTTSNASNTWAAAKVELKDDDSDKAMFEVTGMLPGESVMHCIEVEYTGTTFKLTPIKLYAEAGTETALAPHLDVTVEEGTGATFSANCDGFTKTKDLLKDVPLSTVTSTYTAFDSGVGTFTPASGSTKVAYKFVITLGADTPDSAQGQSAGATFTWEIQSKVS